VSGHGCEKQSASDTVAKSLTFGPALYEKLKIDIRLSASGAWPRDAGTAVSGVLVYPPRIIKGCIFSRPVCSLDSNRLSRCFISIKRGLPNEINLTVARAFSLRGN